MKVKPKTALISVWDKTGLIEFGKGLQRLGIEIIATGGTAKLLKENDVPVTAVADYADYPEMLDGRVKTIQPKIQGGILALRNNHNHMEQLKAHNIKPIDIVVFNLYPFEQVVSKGAQMDEALENIDIGGPTSIRAAAKNFKDVIVVIDSEDYEWIIKELEENGDLSFQQRLKLATKVFRHTSEYDRVIQKYLKEQNER